MVDLPAGPNLVGSENVNTLFSSNFIYEPSLRLVDFFVATNKVKYGLIFGFTFFDFCLRFFFTF